MPARPARHWLFKSEPDAFSIDDLRNAPIQTTCWDGVRNYQARNFLRDDIMPGDGVLYYHSNTDPAAIVGTAEVVRAGYPDHTQFEAGHIHFDPTADPADPRWFMVDIRHVRTFAHPITLQELKGVPGLESMELLRKGSRLSIQPVTPEEWKIVLRIAQRK